MMSTHLREPGALRNTTVQHLYKSQGPVRKKLISVMPVFLHFDVPSYLKMAILLISYGFHFHFINISLLILDKSKAVRHSFNSKPLENNFNAKYFIY